MVDSRHWRCGFAGVMQLRVGSEDILDLVDEAHKLGCFVLVLLVVGDGIVFSLRDRREASDRGLL